MYERKKGIKKKSKKASLQKKKKGKKTSKEKTLGEVKTTLGKMSINFSNFTGTYNDPDWDNLWDECDESKKCKWCEEL